MEILWYAYCKERKGMLKDRMEKLMKELRGIKSQEFQMGYADGCLDMYNECLKEYEEIFAEQTR
jgi:hypothetical protein